MQKLMLSFIAWLILTVSAVYSQPFYKIIEQNPSRLVVECDFSALSPLDIQHAVEQGTSVKGLMPNIIPGEPILPQLLIPLSLPRQTYSPVIKQAKVLNINGVTPVFYTPPDSLEVTYSRAGYPFPQSIVRLEYAGLFREVGLYVLRIFPVQVVETGIRFYQKFTVEVRISSPASRAAAQISPSEQQLIRKFVANKSMVEIAGVASATSGKDVFTANILRHPDRVRIIVEENGIYRVYGRDVENAGIDLATIDPSTFKLTNKGREIAFWIEGDNDGRFDADDFIEFYGERNEKTFFDQYPDLYVDPFTNENVYFLEWGGSPGVRMVEESGSIVSSNPIDYNPAPFYSYTVHVEKNQRFERLGYGSTGQLSYKRDLWFFDSGIKSVGKKQYPFELIYPDSSSFTPVKVKVMFSGKSTGGSQHNVMVWLNNSLVGTARPGWFNQDTATVSNFGNSGIRNFDLRHGENVLDVQLPVKPDFGSDIVLLNWFEVTYDRQYRAFQNEIEFTKPSIVFFPNKNLFQFEIKGFTRPDIEIYKIGTSKIVNFNVEYDDRKGKRYYKVVFQDEIQSPNVRYIAITADRKKKPKRIEVDEPFDPERPELTLHDPSNSADYIIITHPRFYKKALRLRDYRREAGLHVELVNVTDIYDEFNWGIKSPLAIKEFLKYAYFNWNQTHKLKYVLFLGDANYDYKSNSTVFTDFVPTFFFQTFKFGASATDYPYSLLSGDDLIPDVFVGRVPVMSASDVALFIDKLIEYEQNAPVTQWRNQALFISGNDASTFEFGQRQRPVFRSQNSRIMQVLFPRSHSAHRLNTVRDPNLDYDPNFGGTTDLIEYFDDGVYYINFLGHGGGAIWADVNLFNLRDVDRLNNKGMYPFITSMTCFTGAFDNPGNMGLAQKLLLAKDKGAIGLLASSGLGWLDNDFAMLWAVDQFLFNPGFRVGEAIALGKILYVTSGRTYYSGNDLIYPRSYFVLYDDMVHQYNLIGDPYLKIVTTEERLTVKADNQLPSPGDTVNVTVEAPFTGGEGYIELTDYKEDIVNRVPLFLSGNTAVVPFVIPPDFPQGTGAIKAYLSNGEEDGNGIVPIGINYAVVDSIRLIPETPDADDSVYVRVHVKDNEGITRVYLYYPEARDTLYTRRVSASVFETVTPFPPALSIKTVTYDLYIENKAGNTSVFKNLTYTVLDNRPDPFVYSGSIRFTGNKDVGLAVDVGNNGESTAKQLKVNFYLSRQNFNRKIPDLQGQVDILPGARETVVLPFPFPLTQERYSVWVELDAAQLLSDFNRKNNVDSARIDRSVFFVDATLGSTLDYQQTDTLQLNGGNIRVYFPPNSVSENTAVEIQATPFDAPTEQPGLIPVPLKGAPTGDFKALAIKLLNPQAQLLKKFRIEVGYNATQTRRLIPDIYYQNTPETPWVAANAAVDTLTHRLLVDVDFDGRFAPFVTTDDSPPQIELTVDGRPIKRRGQVSSTPNMYLVIEDESGILTLSDQLTLLIDDVPVPKDKIFVPDTLKQNNVVGITLYPELQTGQHRFTVRVKDVNGNVSEEEFELLVSDEFDIHVFGNYPNPFTDKTIFSYFITPDVLDEFEIRIYTLSGRLIRRITEDVNTINQPNGARSPGYNELIWDGRDEDGNEVANGVYFALIRGKYQDQVKEKIIKVAKLK